MMWFPKSPVQWALVLVPIAGISWYLVGFGVGIVVTLVVVGSYFLLYYVTKKTPDVPNPLGAAQDVTAQGDRTKTVVTAKTTVTIASPKRSDFAVPNYDVPHVTFNKTPDGFTVYFKKAKIGTHRVLSNVHQGKSASDAAAGLLALGVVGALHLGQGGSNVEVNREAVIIDEKKWLGAILAASISVIHGKVRISKTTWPCWVIRSAAKVMNSAAVGMSAKVQKSRLRLTVTCVKPQ